MTNQLTPNQLIHELVTELSGLSDDVDELEDRMESLASTIDAMREIANV